MKTSGSLFCALLCAGLFAGCASVDQKTERIPSLGVSLEPLKRSEYQIGAPVSASATVTVERTMMQKLLAPLFGQYIVTGDHTYSATVGVSSETAVAGSRGFATAGGSSSQLADILGSVLGMLGSQSGGSEAVSRATEAAYFKALGASPNADFLLEPRVTVQLKGSSSFFFFVPDSETATVKISGKPVTVNTD